MAIRLTTWNVEWFGQLLKGYTRTIPQRSKRVTSTKGKALQKLQRSQIAEEIRQIDPDILCIQEGPSTGNVDRLEAFCTDDLDEDWTVITRPENDKYLISGSQGIFFLVKTEKLDVLRPTLLPQSAWIEATEYESRVDFTIDDSGEHKRKWPIIHPQFKPGDVQTLAEPEDDDDAGEDAPQLNDREHSHWRHPQVLVCMVGGRRVDFVGLHLKSKFSGDDYAKAGLARRKPEKTAEDIALILRAEQTAVEARIKLSTEAANVRYYVDNRFRNEPNPAVFLLGDLNDGVGKEVFERKYLFHDLISNLQGDVFFANRFLNHALFDYSNERGENHRWTAVFADVWDPYRAPEILLDHILFTQSVCGADAMQQSGFCVPPKAGRVEHEIHNAINAVFDRKEDHTSDHRPVTVDIHTHTPMA
ncbi:endonuclease/exonuclease/phosphatase family protein [Pseudaestuariivita rosea]|uniref:endonuclease/exonuclease/phosphatase family protein n=1 Tax=Pseudaestuariivita rosea TaxID=2763263 RepID=UPI001ABBCC96|nr:endonuclease/exonuclease/phosphatase family protein [Pseudaestuariivita rosea]